jgi:hypothetical protein
MVGRTTSEGSGEGDQHPAAGATIHVGGAHRSHLLSLTIPD